MTGSIRNFEKLNFTPKSSVFCFSQGQDSEYDRLAQVHCHEFRLLWTKLAKMFEKKRFTDDKIVF